MPENLLAIITLTPTPPSFFLLFSSNSSLGNFADTVVYPHCAFNELQKQDEMEDSNYTNLRVRMLTKNQTTKTSTKEFYFSKYHTQKQVL